MKLIKLNSLLALVLVAALASCGGGGGGSTTANSTGLTQLVVFGDSLSDIGTYDVGTVAALGGGKWTVNTSTAKNWTELLAAQYGLPTPCPAQKGLLPILPGFTGAPVTNFSNCRNYAQGGARISSLFGPSSYALQQALAAAGVPVASNSGALGLMTEPVLTQMTQHLSNVNGAYSGTELVSVLAGANDVLMNLNAISGAAGNSATTAIANAQFADWTSLPNWASTEAALMAPGTAAAQNAATQAAQAYLTQAATNLANAIKTQVIAKGAKHVVVINIPDISTTPHITAMNSATTSALAKSLTTLYNGTLQTALAGTGVVFVDAFTQSENQISNPSQFGLSNVTTPACSTTSAANPLRGSALTCTAASTLAGVDTSAYLYADDVHPTPYGYRLLAQFVISKLYSAGIQ